jgi:tRNA (guanine37-N1)-methyltransferase
VRIDVVSIFPEYLEPLRLSLVGKAIEAGRIDLQLHDLREFTHDRHRTVDDSPYGGGPGMVMKPEPWGEALDRIESAATAAPRLVVPTPSGRPFTQALASEFAAAPWLIFACGRYEGIDARVVVDAERRMAVEEVSIGDYVLAGGEAAVLVMVEAIARLLPGVLGNAESAAQDSFGAAGGGILEGPVFTKPARWRELDVPDVLLSGDHAAVQRWRQQQAMERTARRRPDLLDTAGSD